MVTMEEIGKLEQLPPELLDVILSQCEFPSLKDLRRVNRRFSNASTPHVFEHFHMGLFNHGLSNLLHLSKSALSKHIKKFTLHSDILPLVQERHDWERWIDFRPSYEAWLREASSEGRVVGGDEAALRTWFRAEHNTRPRHHFSERELEDGWELYWRLANKQRVWSQQHKGLLFKEYFSALPNLAEVTVRCASPTDSIDTPVWESLRQQILVRPQDWMYSGAYDDTQKLANVGFAALCLLEAVAFRASFSGVKHIQKLTLNSAHRHSYYQLTAAASDLGTPFRNYNTLIDGFTHLRELYLHVPYATDGAETSAEAMARETMIFSRTSSQLRKLDLSYGDGDKIEYEAYKSTFALEPLFRSPLVTWPFLRDLSLVASVGAEDLLNFVRLHSGTLRTLEWRDSASDDFSYILQQLPYVVKLEYVYLECLWQWFEEIGVYLCFFEEGTDGDKPHACAVREYLLHGGDQMPELDEEAWIKRQDSEQSVASS